MTYPYPPEGTAPGRSKFFAGNIPLMSSSKSGSGRG